MKKKKKKKKKREQDSSNSEHSRTECRLLSHASETPGSAGLHGLPGQLLCKTQETVPPGYGSKLHGLWRRKEEEEEKSGFRSGAVFFLGNLSPHLQSRHAGAAPCWFEVFIVAVVVVCAFIAVLSWGPMVDTSPSRRPH